jgi:hypothetical protein
MNQNRIFSYKERISPLLLGYNFSSDSWKTFFMAVLYISIIFLYFKDFSSYNYPLFFKKIFFSIREKFIKEKNLNNNYMIYVTSDWQEVKDEARKEFGKEKLLTNDRSSIHMEKDFNKIETNCDKNDSLKDMILDFNLLKMCDMAVVSQSGFGILGLFNRKNPNKDLYVHTNQYLTKNYWDRSNLHFIKFHTLDDLYFV